jgi:hypothetical protein
MRSLKKAEKKEIRRNKLIDIKKKVLGTGGKLKMVRRGLKNKLKRGDKKGIIVIDNDLVENLKEQIKDKDVKDKWIWIEGGKDEA